MLLPSEGVRPCGKVPARTTHDIKTSHLGIGLEKLDRNLYDPTRCYDYLTELGLKWVRIQSGWARTEKTRGVYDFAWLDEIVDALLAHGLTPWMCLCYGNELYTPGAVNAAGAVGRPPVGSDEEKAAWLAYVRACVAHYKGRVFCYEIWNEPDGDYCWRPLSNPYEYREFAKASARVIHAADPRNKVIVGSVYDVWRHLPYVYHIFDEELAKMTDFVSYHGYLLDPEPGMATYMESVLSILHKWNPDVRLIQGEAGTQSRYSLNGGFNRIDWTERKQAKFILRRLIFDLFHGVYFSSIFSSVDIFENILTDEVNIHESMYGFFGLLGETFDAEGRPLGAYHRKEAFYAAKTVASLFDAGVNPAVFAYSVEKSGLPAVSFDPHKPDAHPLCTALFRDGDGHAWLAYWRASDVVEDDFSSRITIRVFGEGEQADLVDLYDGTVYEIDDARIERDDGIITLRDIPLRDYPLLLRLS